MKVDYKRKCMYLEIIITCVLVLLIGALGNKMVMDSNDGKMPVLHSYWSFETDEHFSFSADRKDMVNHWYLGDVIPLNFLGPLSGIYSIGDLVMVVAFAGMVSCIVLMRYGKWKVYHE